jgi:hypothetical protein
MEFKINTTSQNGEILTTNVTYTFDCGSELTVDIAHYLPNSVEEIKQNIINRSISEKIKMNTVNNMSNIINEIPVNQTIQIN